MGSVNFALNGVDPISPRGFAARTPRREEGPGERHTSDSICATVHCPTRGLRRAIASRSTGSDRPDDLEGARRPRSSISPRVVGRTDRIFRGAVRSGTARRLSTTPGYPIPTARALSPASG